MRIEIIDPLASPDLGEWLRKVPGATIFHSTSWARVMAESYRFQPVYLVLTRRGSFAGCLPVMEVDSPITGRRGVCLSFSDYCAAIVDSDHDFRLLFNTLLEYAGVRKWRYVEFRGEPRLGREMPSEVYAHHQIPLSRDLAQMQSRLRKSTARSIQKAVKEGVRVEMSHGLDELLEYYRLHCLTRRRQGLPPQPREYFLKLHEHVIGQKLGFTALARQGGTTFAGIVCLHYGGNAIYKYGASDLDFQHLRANNLLFWESIKKYGRDGFRSLSLGRTDLDNEGLLVFKDGWGGERSSLNYHRFDLARREFDPPRPSEVARYRGLFRKLPVGLLQIVGRVAYRHFG